MVHSDAADMPPSASHSSLIRGLAAIADPRVPTNVVVKVVRPLLPATRLDVLLADAGAGRLRLLLSTDEGRAPDPPAAALADEVAFVQWLRRLGHAPVENFPLLDGAQRVGQLVVSRTARALTPVERALAVELAQAFTVRYRNTWIAGELDATREALRAAQARLAASEQVQQQAIRAVGAIHNLGNVLTTILGFVDLLQHEVPPMLRNDLQALMRAARDGSRIIQRVLTRDDTLAVGAGGRTDVATVIQEVLTLTRPMWGRDERVSVITDLSPVPPIQADPSEVREVLVNLILNALAAMPDGGILTLRSWAEADQVVIAVADTGEGIAREAQAMIFVPLQTTRPGGSGLGLTVSREIVTRAGGQLSVESAPGRGAMFLVVLPAAQENGE